MNEVELVAGKLGVRPVPALVVPAIRAPFLWCLGSVRLVWPEALVSDTQLARSRSIIAHELAHVRRRDHWVAWLELIAGVIWWWNPLFWFVRRQLRESSEMACDAIALRVYHDRREYAEMFLELSSSFKTGAPAPVLGVGTGAPSSFERRLSMILNDRVTGQLSVRGFLLAAVLAAVTLPNLMLAQTSSDDELHNPTEGDTPPLQANERQGDTATTDQAELLPQREETGVAAEPFDAVAGTHQERVIELQKKVDELMYRLLIDLAQRALAPPAPDTVRQERLKRAVKRYLEKLGNEDGDGP